MNVLVTSTIEAATRHVKRLLQYSYVNSIATPLLVNAKFTIERSFFNAKSKLFDPNKLETFETISILFPRDDYSKSKLLDDKIKFVHFKK